MNAEKLTSSNEIMISVKDLKKSFGKLEVLKSIDCDIHKGEVVCVIGPSGSGKSTFLRCLNLLEEPNGGSICFKGTDITAKGVNINKYRQKLGMVFQQFNLFPHMTILKNLTFAPVKLGILTKAQAEERAMQLLARVGLARSGQCSFLPEWVWLTERMPIPHSFRAVRSRELPLCVLFV